MLWIRIHLPYGLDHSIYDLSWTPGTAPQRLSNNPYHDSDPQIDNGQVVWHGKGEIYYYDLSWAPGTATP